MGNKLKIASGIAKGAVGCAAFGCSVAINGIFKSVSGGFGLPSYQGSSVQEGKELLLWVLCSEQEFLCNSIYFCNVALKATTSFEK